MPLSRKMRLQQQILNLPNQKRTLFSQENFLSFDFMWIKNKNASKYYNEIYSIKIKQIRGSKPIFKGPNNYIIKCLIFSTNKNVLKLTQTIHVFGYKSIWSNALVLPNHWCGKIILNFQFEALSNLGWKWFVPQRKFNNACFENTRD